MLENCAKEKRKYFITIWQIRTFVVRKNLDIYLAFSIGKHNIFLIDLSIIKDIPLLHNTGWYLK